MLSEASHPEQHPPTPEDARWAAGLAHAKVGDPRHRRSVASSRRFDRATAAVVGFALVLLYAIFSVLLASHSMFVFVVGLACVITWVQFRSSRPATMWAASALLGLIYTGVWSLLWFTQWPTVGALTIYLAATMLGGPLAGCAMGLAINAVHWGASILRWWFSSDSAVASDQLSSLPDDSTSAGRVSIYSVPRRFDVATLLTVSFAYSLLFTLLKLLDSHWSVFAFIGGLTVAVALGQMLARSDKEIRNASFMAGALYTLAWCFVMVVVSRMWAQGVVMLVFCFIAGPLLGYVTGVVDAGVFLIADKVRKRLE